MKPKLILLLTIASLVSSIAHAQSGGKGGGAGIICKNKMIGPTSLTVLDYYEEVKPFVDPKIGWVEYDQNRQFDEQPVATYENEPTLKYYGGSTLAGLAMNSSLDEFVGLAIELSNKLDAVGEPSQWIPKKLQVMKDLNLTHRIPFGCKIVQIAERDQGIFYIDPEQLPKLSSYQQGILQFHETVYALAAEMTGLDSAEPVRKLFATAYAAAKMKVSQPGSSFPGFADALQALSKNVEAVFGAVYLSRIDYAPIWEFDQLFFQGDAFTQAQTWRYEELKKILLDLYNTPHLNQRERNMLEGDLTEEPFNVKFPPGQK
jgi:hypothetical protein